MMYPSDLTDTEWNLLQPLLPSPSPRGRPRLWALRHIVNGIFYLLRAGCPWRFLPQDYPPWPTVYHYFRRWQQTGLWHLMHEALRQAVRVMASRHPLPSAAIIDSQSVKTTVESGTIKGYDGHKHVKGRKRHLLVDTLGMLVSVYVTPADTADRTGAQWLLTGLQPLQPRLELIWADGAYSGEALAAWCQAEGSWRLDIIKPQPQVKGFMVRPWCWIVERTLAWIDRCRRLGKDYERKVQTSEHLHPNRDDSFDGQAAGTVTEGIFKHALIASAFSHRIYPKKLIVCFVLFEEFPCRACSSSPQMRSSTMPPMLSALCAWMTSLLRSRASLHLENLALQHQLAVYKQTVARPRLRPTDRLFWAWLSRLWPGWEAALAFVQPRTVIAWQRRRFRAHWRCLSQQGQPGRPAIAKEVRALIREMSQANPTWGAPRIVGELQKLGIDVAKSTVEKYHVRSRKPPSPTWKIFLQNHLQDPVALDFFTVPTVTYKVLFVLIIHHMSGAGWSIST